MKLTKTQLAPDVPAELTMTRTYKDRSRPDRNFVKNCWNIILIFGLLIFASTLSAQTTEVRDRTALRVCADPGNLPFSNDKEEGFENKIAEVVAEELQIPIHYTWFPQTRGFIRNTLRVRKCDLVMGISSAHELLLNTNHYYRSVFVLFFRKDSGITGTQLSDPQFRKLRIGVVAGTPPANLMLKYELFDNHRPYQLIVDTRIQKSGRDMVADVASGEVDVGLLWGPIAGYYIGRQNVKMTVLPIRDEPDMPKMNYRITMGVRHGEIEWKRTLNKIIRKRQQDINQILMSYGLLLLDRKGNPIIVP
jgi:quinoprotein dehydrogenase-associated probable ABC transporter substrate-binding protein